MSRFGDEDLKTFVSDFAVDIVHGGITAKGIVDYNDAAVGDAPVPMADRITKITVPYNAFTTITREGAITVDGVAMVVRHYEQMDDGGIVFIWAVLA